MSNNQTKDPLNKFQELLKNLFQFETADLDFGIYRILNFKRAQIEKFIDYDLKNRVEQAFSKYKDERLENIKQKLEEAKKNVIENVNADAFTAAGDIKPEFMNTKAAKIYLVIKEQKNEAGKIDEIKLQVFRDLHDFFSRYYEEGDFVPHYRYSIKQHKYAIPYNGEEVALYWANKNQYYIKTGTLFRDYTFLVQDYKAVFRIVEAKEELGSNKATKERFFILDDEGPVELNDKTVTIRFHYRELTEDEVKNYQVAGGSNRSRQEKINVITHQKVLVKIADKALKALFSKDKNEKPLLLYQLNRFTARNTMDYFIHKDLKGFLSNQLDYFIKAEVLSLETLEQEKFLDKHITRAKVVREIGEAIIAFLSQIEDFQKKLWEKKKFVLKTDYVITTDRVPDEFHAEILKNKEQRKEWESLGFDLSPLSPKDKKSLKNLKLPVDTKHFSLSFKEKLLEKLTDACHPETNACHPETNACHPETDACHPETDACHPELVSGSHEMSKQVRHDQGNDLDDLLDGLLIKSENYQALNLLLNKYREKVQTIYIDPPFNLDSSDQFLYRTNYKDSNWATLLENRLKLAKNVLDKKGSIFVRCDYNGNWIVRCLMDNEFRKENFRNELVINKSNKQGAIDKRFNPATETLFLYSKTEDSPINPQLKKREKQSGWLEMHSPKENKNSHSVIFDGITFIAPKGRHWSFAQDTVNQLILENRIRVTKKQYTDVYGNKQEKVLEYLMSVEETIESDWTDIPGYSSTTGFQTENSEKLLFRVINTGSWLNEIVFDFFLGSGTTTAVAHKLKRKWIGVEMGEHFYSVVLPRMKKVLAYDKSGISKEADVKEKYNEKSAGGFFKYQVLEQYEDALDNIELKSSPQAETLFKDDYLLKYFLDFETRESDTLLNIDKLKNPFSYKLKVNLSEVGEPQEMVVDIPETFNYLIGLKVKRIKAREFKKRKYLFILGEKNKRNTAVVWREYDENWDEADFKQDKKYIMKELDAWQPVVVYINGQSVLTASLGKNTIEVRCIEPEFKKLMTG